MTRCVALIVVLVAACGDPQSLPCEEPGGTDGLPRVSVVIADTEVSAEVAQDAETRERAWAGRHCDLDGLLWIPDLVEPPAVSLCGVELSVDLAFLRSGSVVAVEIGREGCDGPCETCPRYGETGPAVDAVLWLPTGQVQVAVGDAVTGLEAVTLPE